MKNKVVFVVKRHTHLGSDALTISHHETFEGALKAFPSTAQPVGDTANMDPKEYWGEWLYVVASNLHDLNVDTEVCYYSINKWSLLA